MANQPLPDVWSTRHLPVLREAARIIEFEPMGMTGARFHSISDATGLTVDEIARAARALEDEGLISVVWSMPARAARISGIDGRARRLVGLWPTPETAFDRIVAALEILSAQQGGHRADAQQALDAFRHSAEFFRRTIGTAALTGEQP